MLISETLTIEGLFDKVYLFELRRRDTIQPWVWSRRLLVEIPLGLRFRLGNWRLKLGDVNPHAARPESNEGGIRRGANPHGGATSADEGLALLSANRPRTFATVRALSANY